MQRTLWLLVLVGAAAGQVSEMSLDPLLSFVSCLRDDKPGFCMRERALGYFETWLTGDEDADVADTAATGGEEDEEPGSKLNPYWKKMIDQVAERIAGFYGEEEETEEEAKGLSQHNQTQGKSSALDGENDLARGHKKKKKIKAIKKALIKLVLIALLIKSKLKMLLTAFQTFLQFKAVLLATILVLIHAAKLWIEIKHKHHPQKVIYYENAHHQHHYDHHDDHHGWDDHGSGGNGWSLWGRSGLEATTTSIPILPSFLGRSAKDLPYAAQIPKQIAGDK